MSLWATAGCGHDFSRAPGSDDPEGVDAFGAVAVDEVGFGARLGEEIPTAPHARLVCVHLQALPFLVALFTLTAITMVILTPAVPPVNGKSTPRAEKDPSVCINEKGLRGLNRARAGPHRVRGASFATMVWFRARRRIPVRGAVTPPRD
jgi:hypothetical protein